MANLATQQVARAGLAPAYAAAADGGDKVTPGPRTFLHVKNGNAGAVNVTVVTPGKVATTLDVADLVVAVPAGGERMIGPVTADVFRNPADGKADVQYSAAASVTVAALTV